jgi:hypothetical protein
MKNYDKKFIFGIIFGFGLLLCLISDEVFANTQINDVNALAFSILITLFGGCGLLIAIFKNH